MSLPGALLPWIELRFFLADGTPNAGGKVWFYAAGTSLPQDTFSDSDLTVPNTNPVVLDADGRAPDPIYISPTGYKVVVMDADDVVLYTFDNVSDPSYTFFANLGVQLYQGSKSVVNGYTITNDDSFVTVHEPTPGACVVNLQPAAERTSVLIIQNRSVAVTVTPVGVETINSIAGPVILPEAADPVYPTAIFISDGISDYAIIGGWGIG